VYIEREAEAAAILAARIEDGSLAPAHIWSDLATFDASQLRGKVDLILGGLPCQPFSVAGKRRGDQDERYIWPDFIRIVGECRPAMVWLENVPAFVTAGWFRAVGEELCRMGYQIEDPLFIRASDIGAPHRRERVFILAHADSRSSRETDAVPEGRSTAEPSTFSFSVEDAARERRNRVGDTGARRRRELTDTGGDLFTPGPGDTEAWSELLVRQPWLRPAISQAEIESAVCECPDGLADLVVQHRTDALRGLGNAVIPIQAAAAFILLARRAGVMK